MLVIVAVTLASLVAYVQFMAKSLEPELEANGEPELQGIPIPSLTPLEIRNPEIAPKYGIVGYVEITLVPGSPESLSIGRGEEANITILLRFVSHVPEITETQVKIDPKSREGLMIEQCYATGVVSINKLVSYNQSGIVALKAGQTLPVTLTIRIPIDFPSGVSSFPLGAVGITANAPIIDDVQVKVYPVR